MTQEPAAVTVDSGTININLNDVGDREQENKEAMDEGVEETFPPVNEPQKPEVSVETMEKFMTETYQFVTRMHLEMSAVTSVLVNRGVITTDELNAAFGQIQQEYAQQMQLKAMKDAGLIDPSGVPTEQQEIDRQCGIDIGAQPKKEEGRKPPAIHGG